MTEDREREGERGREREREREIISSKELRKSLERASSLFESRINILHCISSK